MIFRDTIRKGIAFIRFRVSVKMLAGFAKVIKCTHLNLQSFSNSSNSSSCSISSCLPIFIKVAFSAIHSEKLRYAASEPHCLISRFQFTRPRRVRLPGHLYPPSFQCFNSRAHEGRDHGLFRASVEQLVSIHAPTKGATLIRSGVVFFPRVSIHAPTKGATGITTLRLAAGLVSIHAPTKGATILQ